MSLGKHLAPKKCKCGATVICAVPQSGPVPKPKCGTCRTYGLEFSKEERLNLREVKTC